jgi:hypothetical protein
MPPRRLSSARSWFLLFALLAGSVGPVCASDLPQAAYPLDALPRILPERAPLPCETGGVPLIPYRGELLRYQKPVQIHPAFRAQLAAFERIVAEVATQYYGRAPKTVVHMGGYNCRRMRLYPTWVSEHALGNAIDIAGFDFGPAARDATLPGELPRALRRAFQVRLVSHWNAKGVAHTHGRFLRALAQAVIARPDVFHVVLGPAWPGHKNHFHLDHAPYRVVEVFETH